MSKQNETITIVSYTSQNSERQEELRRGVDTIMGNRPFRMLFAASDAEAESLLGEANVLFTWRFTEPMFSVAKKLQWIHVSGAGVDSLLFPEFVNSPIVLTNSRGMHGTPIAEWTLASLLYISQCLSAAGTWRRDHQWKPHKQAMTTGRFMLDGRRALIVGYGSIGEAIARRLQALGVICEGVVTSLRPAAIPLHTSDELPQLIGTFDIVISALPLTPRTHHIFNRELFSHMQPGVIFVNVGRGKTVNESDLINSLRNGPLAYAALDVFATEPLPEDSPLFDVPNLFMTPHISGNFPEYSARAIQSFLTNFARFIHDQPLLNIVDKPRGY